MERINVNAKNVFCVGDIHGDFLSILSFIAKYDIQESAIVFCGDCGFGFNKSDYYGQIIRKLNKTCVKKSVYLLFIRGNHDDPSYFRKHSMDTNYIRLVHDYDVVSVYDIDDKDFRNPPRMNILCVGGGISIDRAYRIECDKRQLYKYLSYHRGISAEEASKKSPKTYWEDENAVYLENELKELDYQGIKIDYVCTHSCPSFCEPQTKNGIQHWLDKDRELEIAVDNDRIVFDNIYAYLKTNGHPLKAWYYGHYHFHNFMVYEDTKFYLLDMAHSNANFDMVEIIEENDM